MTNSLSNIWFAGHMSVSFVFCQLGLTNQTKDVQLMQKEALGKQCRASKMCVQLVGSLPAKVHVVFL